MANETTTANVSSGNPTLKSSVLIQEIRERTIILPFLKMVDLTGQPGLTYDFQDLTVTPSASAITTGANEADAITNTQLTTSSRSATAASKGVGALISTLQMSASAVNWAMEAPMILGRALADLMDVDFAALLAGFSNVAGTSGADATVADLISALVLLRSNAKGLAEDSQFILHPQQMGDVVQDMASGSGAGLAAMSARPDVATVMTSTPGQGLTSTYAGTFLGKPVFQSTNVSAGGGTRHGAIFVNQVALGGVVKWMPRVAEFDKGVDAQLAMQFLGSTAYGGVEVKDLCRVTISTDE